MYTADRLYASKTENQNTMKRLFSGWQRTFEERSGYKFSKEGSQVIWSFTISFYFNLLLRSRSLGGSASCKLVTKICRIVHSWFLPLISLCSLMNTFWPTWDEPALRHSKVCNKEMVDWHGSRIAQKIQMLPFYRGADNILGDSTPIINRYWYPLEN